jgi:hypothetical protein
MSEQDMTSKEEVSDIPAQVRNALPAIEAHARTLAKSHEWVAVVNEDGTIDYFEGRRAFFAKLRKVNSGRDTGRLKAIRDQEVPPGCMQVFWALESLGTLVIEP